MALDNWNEFNGWARARGVKILKETPADFQDLVLFWLTDGLSEKGLMDLERQLTIPPAMHKVDKADPVWGREAEMAAFKAAAKR